MDNGQRFTANVGELGIVKLLIQGGKVYIYLIWCLPLDHNITTSHISSETLPISQISTIT